MKRTPLRTAFEAASTAATSLAATQVDPRLAGPVAGVSVLAFRAAATQRGQARNSSCGSVLEVLDSMGVGRTRVFHGTRGPRDC